jgi:hypothetical protein
MLNVFLISSGEVVQVGKDDASEIMKNISHSPLKCRTCVLYSKRHDTIGKSTPRGSECSFLQVCWMNMNLSIAREPIHKGKCLVAGTIIYNLIDEGHWEVVFGIGMIEIAKVSADTNSAMFFVDRDRVGDP